MTIESDSIQDGPAPANGTAKLNDRALTSASLGVWRGAQYVVLLAGVALVGALFYQPAVGINIMWNVLIPVAPALIVVAPGLWRNICPMATLSLLPRRLGFSRQEIPSRQWIGWLGAAGLLALLAIVPLRHLSLNTSGPLTALMLVLSGAIALSMGMAYEWRSGWCNSLCPIHPAERLYGFSPGITFANARCDECRKCTTPCPDSTRSMDPSITGPSLTERAVGNIMIGGFAGFIWGWYRIPDYRDAVGADEILSAYFWPFGGALETLAIYAAVNRWVCSTNADRRLLIRFFATAAVCTYYWYRIPALAGFGPHPGSGMLWDLHRTLPDLSLISRVLTTSFFIWFMLLREDPRASWLMRPIQRPLTPPVAPAPPLVAGNA